jgi:hypothetical protein
MADSGQGPSTLSTLLKTDSLWTGESYCGLTDWRFSDCRLTIYFGREWQIAGYKRAKSVKRKAQIGNPFNRHSMPKFRHPEALLLEVTSFGTFGNLWCLSCVAPSFGAKRGAESNHRQFLCPFVPLLLCPFFKNFSKFSLHSYPINSNINIG